MRRGKFQKKATKTPIWYSVLLILLIGLFAYGAGYLADYRIRSREQVDDYEELASLVEANRPVMTTEPTAAATIPETEVEMLHTEKEILPEYAPLYQSNPDMVGWICIEDTKINYPVMQTPDRLDYYLQRNFQGKPSAWGSIYAREECDIEAPSDNITLYGHNAKDGSMFGGLNDYTSRAFWEQHRYIRFDTLKEHHTYEVFAVFRTTASQGEGFAYHDFIDGADEEEFDEFISQCLSLALYDTDRIPQYGDKIICLSTCEYSRTNGRLVVAAVRID